MAWDCAPRRARQWIAHCRSGCTVTNCAIGLHIDEDATATIAHNDLSFNQIAVVMHGRGVIRDNVIWGNLGHAIELPEHLPTCPSCCSVSAPHHSWRGPGPLPHQHLCRVFAADDGAGLLCDRSLQVMRLSSVAHLPTWLFHFFFQLMCVAPYLS